MAQTKQGALKVAAKNRGITYSDYLEKIKEGLKWCSGCKQWHDYSAFGLDATRSDGLSASCLKYRRLFYKKSYTPKKRKSKKGSRFVKVRDGDRKQARSRVNHLVEIGLFPSPNSLKCSICNNTRPSKRNEYHHHNGYGRRHHEDVIVMCSSCHADLHKNRKQEE